MSQISLLFDDSWNWFAVEVALKATIVLLIAAGLVAATRSASAAWRHRIWSLGFAGLLLLPLLQLAMPGWSPSCLSGGSIQMAPPRIPGIPMTSAT